MTKKTRNRGKSRPQITGVMGAAKAGTLMPGWSGDSERKAGGRMTEGRGERATRTPDVMIHDPDDVVGGVAGGGSGERATGTPNTIYNLSSVLFHALQGGASYDTYVEDAEREGDEELTEFFRRVRKEDRDRAAEARTLLAERTPVASPTEEGAPSGASSRTEPSTDLSGMEAVAEGAPSGDVRRGNIVAQMREEDLTPPEGAVPPDVPGPSNAPKTERVPPRTTEGASPPSTPGTEEGAPPPRPEPSSDFPGTEPIRENASAARTGEVPPPPEEIPPERAGEIPTAEEVPTPRAEEVPKAEEGPAGTPSPRTQGASLDPPLSEEEMVRRQAQRERGGADKGLTDEVEDTIFDEEKRRGGTGREDLR